MDARLIIEAVLGVAGFLSAFWLQSIRSDIHEIVKQLANHGERLAVAESQLERLDREVGRNTWRPRADP